MKKIIFLVLFIFSLGVLGVQHFWRGQVLSADDVGKKWGTSELKIDEFKKGNEKIRASMAHSLVKRQKDFVGTFVTEIRKKFGDPDGFYFSDVFPAYMIHRGKTNQEESWQIVFLLNNDRKVEKVIVHKNCCD